MFFIVVGCGRVGSELAYGLFRQGHQVAVIDHVGTSFSHLHPEYRGRTIEAGVLAQDVLKNAGVEQADGLAAVTNSDPVNAVVAHVARRIYGVQRVVARNYDPRWLPLHETFGLPVVSSTAWGAERIQELLSGARHGALFAAGQGEVQLHELRVPAAWAGRTLGALLLGAACVPLALTRGGRAVLAGLEQRLEAGDVLHVGTAAGALDVVRARLQGEA